MTKISTIPPMKDADKLAALRKLERSVKAADRLVESCSESLKAAKEERSVAIERLRTASDELGPRRIISTGCRRLGHSTFLTTERFLWPVPLRSGLSHSQTGGWGE